MLAKLLRPYQEQAIRSLSASVAKKKSPVAVIFVGGGKSLIIAEIIRRILAKNGEKRVLVLVDSKELIQQNYIEFCEYVGIQSAHVAGIYSSGLGRKEKGSRVLFAGIQSYVNYVENSGVFDFVIIDECHLVPTNENSQYRRVLAIEKSKNSNVAVLGFTGTPWRMDTRGGTIADSDLGVFDEIACMVGCHELISSGYLAHVISYDKNITEANLTGVKIENGEYVEKQATKAFLKVLPAQVQELLQAGQSRKKWIVFCQSCEHAMAMHQALEKHVSVAVVFGDSPNRNDVLADFKAGKYRALVNVQVLRKGVNFVDVDLVVLCFATQSVSDYVQKVGRGMRISPGKKDCLVLDFGGNIARHGPIDRIEVKKRSEREGVAPMKQCPKCGGLVSLRSNICDVCGYVFLNTEGERGKDLTPRSQRGGIMSSEPEMVPVTIIAAKLLVTKKGDPCITVDFYSDEQDYYPIHKEFLNLWNKNQFAVSKSLETLFLIAGEKTQDLIAEFESPLRTANKINELILNGKIKTPKFIFLQEKGRFKKIVDINL